MYIRTLENLQRTILKGINIKGARNCIHFYLQTNKTVQFNVQYETKEQITANVHIVLRES